MPFLRLGAGAGMAMMAGVASAQQALTPTSGVAVTTVVSLGLLIGAALFLLRAGSTFGEAMRIVRKAAEFGATVEGLVETVEALRKRVEVLEERGRNDA